jgi:predicted enzyme related to lactoylglutathione lyase
MDFNSILIGSEDAPALAAYYTKVLGAPAFSNGTFTAWQVGSGFVTVGPHSEVKGRNTAPGRLIWNMESKDVKGDFERLKSAGAIVVTEPYEFERQPGSSIATFADLDGNYFQLLSPMEM